MPPASLCTSLPQHGGMTWWRALFAWEYPKTAEPYVWRVLIWKAMESTHQTFKWRQRKPLGPCYLGALFQSQCTASHTSRTQQSEPTLPSQDLSGLHCCGRSVALYSSVKTLKCQQQEEGVTKGPDWPSWWITDRSSAPKEAKHQHYIISWCHSVTCSWECRLASLCTPEFYEASFRFADSFTKPLS